MKNNDFTELEERKRKAKLKGILKKRLGAYLSNVELETVLNAVKLSRQYAIKLFFKKEDFLQTLTLPKTCKGEIILGSADFGVDGKVGFLKNDLEPVVAIVWIRSKTVKNQIRVFIPENRRKARYKTPSVSILCDGECVAEKRICEHIVYGEQELYCELMKEQGGVL